MRPTSKTRVMAGARGFILGLGLLLAACAAPEAPPPSPAPAAPTLRWTAAIGLLAPGQGQLKCTAVLVAPDLIATAAHCFYPNGSTSALQPSAFVFHPNLGASPSIPEARGTVMRAIGGVVLQGQIGDFEAPFDWALLQIAPPVTAVPPLPVAAFTVDQMLERVAGGDRLFVAGYGNGTNDALHLPSPCRIVPSAELKLQLDDRLIVTDCVFRIGDSGGPVVLIDAAGKPRLIGVISGFGKHPTKTIPLGYAANAGSFTAFVQGPVISLLN